jgi:hypothetical protein
MGWVFSPASLPSNMCSCTHLLAWPNTSQCASDVAKVKSCSQGPASHITQEPCQPVCVPGLSNSSSLQSPITGLHNSICKLP